MTLTTASPSLEEQKLSLPELTAHGPAQKEPAFLSVVLYTQNDAEQLPDFLKKLDWFLCERFQQCEIILVDNGSRDDTHRIVQKLSPSLETSITYLRLPWNHSLEVAMLAGIDFSIGDFILELDSCDPNYQLEVIDRLLAKAQQGYDIVSAVPVGKKSKLSHAFYGFFNALPTTNLTLTAELCRLLTRRAVNAATAIKDKTFYRKIMYSFSGCRKTSVSVKTDRKYTNKLSVLERFHLATDILFSFTPIGTYITLFFSTVFTLISIGLGIHALYAWVYTDDTVKGWTTLMLFLSFGFSGLFLVIACITVYLSLILKETKSFPSYTLEMIQKI